MFHEKSIEQLVQIRQKNLNALRKVIAARTEEANPLLRLPLTATARVLELTVVYRESQILQRESIPEAMQVLAGEFSTGEQGYDHLRPSDIV